jgi:hypothetical protein
VGSSSPPPMDLGLSVAGRTGSGGGGGWRGSGGGASAAAWTRLVSSGVEDELVPASGGGGGGGGRAGARAGGLPLGHFLEACFLCRKPLPSNRDIFMYRFATLPPPWLRLPLALALPLPGPVPLVLLYALCWEGWFWEFLRRVPWYGRFRRLWKVYFPLEEQGI